MAKKKKLLKKTKRTPRKKTKKPLEKKTRPSVIKKTKKVASAKKIFQKKKEKPIGMITHFYDKISVAVVKLFAPLSVGDEVEIKGGEVDFKQKVSSMQVEHQAINSAKKGDEIGMKINKKAREGYRVFKI